ncbi:MAG: hypothetical protein ABSC47_08180 [Terracidiphilus sp.]|jgi:hypothetical protein
MGSEFCQEDDLRWTFVCGTFLSNAVRDSIVSRSGRRVYANGKTEIESRKFWKLLTEWLYKTAFDYKIAVDEKQHVKNIETLVHFLSNHCSEALNDGRVTYGFAQKALNSYLKYLWCDRRIPPPPHCPFDSIILGMLELSDDCERRWTHGEKGDYLQWFSTAKLKANGMALCEWELREWGRRDIR